MILVLAFGNPLRGDDGVAWIVAKALGDRPDTRIVCRHQLGPELAENVSRANGVLFIDASIEGPPGEVRVQRVDPKPSDADLTHALGPAPLLHLAAALYGAAPAAFLLAVGGRDFGYGPGLSPPVRAALPQAEAAARAALAQLAAL